MALENLDPENSLPAAPSSEADAEADGVVDAADEVGTIPDAVETAPLSRDSSEELSRWHKAEIFGSFWIDGTEFALPVSVIQEVVNEPENFTPVPLSSPFMTGLFNLRGRIVPVIDLRMLLEYPAMERDVQRKVAIIENGELCIGLLFDDTGGIVSSEGATRVNFEANSDGIKDIVVEGMLKLDNGERMVQILDPYEILKIEKTPRIGKHSKDDIGQSKLGKRLNCISFQVGHTNCAIDLRYVQEITEVPEIQNSQLAHGHILGNILLRGHTIPVVDFRGVIGNEQPHKFNPDALKSRKLVILGLPEGQIGLLVYTIDSIISYFESEVLPFAKIAIPRHDIVAGCLVTDSDEIVILLDHAKLMSDRGLVDAARSCQEIFPPKTVADKSSEDLKIEERQTYILFTVEVSLALDISCVCEILNRPEKLLKPPYALEFVEGILNLRGELITLINPRHLYGFPESETPGQKILIFKKDAQKYGIVVDSVDEIVATTKGMILEVPAIQRQDISRAISKDVLGCLQVPTRGPECDPIMILNVASLIARCADNEIDLDSLDPNQVASAPA